MCLIYIRPTNFKPDEVVTTYKAMWQKDEQHFVAEYADRTYKTNKWYHANFLGSWYSRLGRIEYKEGFHAWKNLEDAQKYVSFHGLKDYIIIVEVQLRRIRLVGKHKDHPEQNVYVADEMKIIKALENTDEPSDALTPVHANRIKY